MNGKEKKEKRTVLHFVEEMIADGRSLEEIKQVTFNSKWASKWAEIKDLTKNLLKKSGK